MRTVSIHSFAALVLALGCRASNNPEIPPSDLSHPTASDGGLGDSAQDGGADGGSKSSCLTYNESTIADMRQAKSGCYQLTGVVAIGVTPSTSSPTLYVQDAAGGDFSAMQTKCSSTSSSHKCNYSGVVAGTKVGNSVTLMGTYIKSKTNYEEFYIENVMPGAAATAPDPLKVTAADVQKGANAPGKWFQRVSLTVTTTDPLLMYNWSPAEMQHTYNNMPNTKCPYWDGFSMVPKSAHATAGAACNMTTQPASAMPNASEILIGTDFYKTFTVSSDCACAATYKDKLVTATTQLSGTVSGILVYESPQNGTPFQYLAPQAMTDAALTNLQ